MTVCGVCTSLNCKMELNLVVNEIFVVGEMTLGSQKHCNWLLCPIGPLMGCTCSSLRALLTSLTSPFCWLAAELCSSDVIPL